MIASTGDGDRRATVGEDPYLAPPEQRRTDRRLRGRLIAPVTVWTAGAKGDPSGLTVSSVLVAEGDPAHLLALIDPLSPLPERASDSGALVVHLLGAGDERLAAVFAGAYPVDPFAELSWTEDAFGPVLAGSRTIARCRFAGSEPVGFQALLRAEIVSVDFAAGLDPLAWFHRAYRTLA